MKYVIWKVVLFELEDRRLIFPAAVQQAADDLESGNTVRMAWLSYNRRKLGIPNLVILYPTAPSANRDRKMGDELDPRM